MDTKTVQEKLQNAYNSMLEHVEELVDKDKKPLKEAFEENLSPAKLSNLAKAFNQFRVAWQESKLEEYYKVVFLDCIFVTARRKNSYSKEAVYIATGVRKDNKRELLALDLAPSESSSVWEEILKELKEKRGVKNITLFVSDDFQGAH